LTLRHTLKLTIMDSRPTVLQLSPKIWEKYFLCVHKRKTLGMMPPKDMSNVTRRHVMSERKCTRRVNQRPGDRVFTEDHQIMNSVRNFPTNATHEMYGKNVMDSRGMHKNIHDGPRNQLVNETQFLTRVHRSYSLQYNVSPDDKSRTPVFLCVYAGACPGHHIDHLLEMFPHVYWLLIDKGFNRPEHRQMIQSWDPTRVAVCYEDFDNHNAMAVNSWVRGHRHGHSVQLKLDTLDLRASLVTVDTLLFISDIGNDPYNQSLVATEMDQQAQWFRQLNASAALLKFRLPACTTRWKQGVHQHHNVRKYLDGCLYLPVWGPRSGSECRLYVKRGCATRFYKPWQHELTMNAFNAHDRGKKYTFNARTFNSFDAVAEAAAMHAFREQMGEYRVGTRPRTSPPPPPPPPPPAPSNENRDENGEHGLCWGVVTDQDETVDV
jgi:hypothetical protein